MYSFVSHGTKNQTIRAFSYFDIERQVELVAELPDIVVAAVLNEMEPDNRTRLLECLETEIRHKILLKLDPEERQVAWKLLSYPEDSVGRLMTPDFVFLHKDMTIAQSLEYIHWSHSVPVEYLNFLFVVDEHERLIGEVSLASLVITDPASSALSTVMKKTYIFLNPTQEASEAVEVFRKYDQQQIPVVDEQQKLLGIVTADDLFDVAEEEATEDIQQFGGQGALDSSYFNTPFLTMIQKRAGWLSILFCAGFSFMSGY